MGLLRRHKTVGCFMLYVAGLLALESMHFYYLHDTQKLIDALRELQPMVEEVVLSELDFASNSQINADPVPAVSPIEEQQSSAELGLRIIVLLFVLIAIIHQFGPEGMPLPPIGFGGGSGPEAAEPMLEATASELTTVFDIEAMPFLLDPICVQYGVEPEVVHAFFRSSDYVRQAFILDYLDTTQTLRRLSDGSAADCLKIVRGDPEGIEDLR